MIKMRNNYVQSGVIVQQMKQWCSCYNQSLSGRLLGVELDYLVYFVSHLGTLYLNVTETLHVIKCFLGGPRGVAKILWSPPLVGGFGDSVPEAKNRCKISL